MASDWRNDQEIIFSLQDGYVWASWPDGQAVVRLGRHGAVSAMMRDFIAQDDLAARMRLAKGTGESP